MAIDRELLNILACPQCRGEVRLAPDGKGLLCGVCRLIYPIRDGIPILLIEEAVPLT